MSPVGTGRSPAWSLVDTRADLGDLTRSVVGGASVLLTGPAGIGKTTTATLVAARLDAAGDEPVWVHGLAELTDVRLGALSPLLARERGPRSPTDRLLALHERLSRARSTVVVVDDAQWLDPTSLGAVAQLVDSGVRCVVTARDGVELPGVLARAADAGRLRRLQMAPLTLAETGQLVAANLAEHVAPSTLVRWHEVSGGNPLFLRELLVAAGQPGALRPSPDGLQLTDVPLPGVLAEAVAAEIARVGPESRELLGLLAVAQPLPVGAVAGDAGLGELEMAGLVRRQDDELLLTHPLHGEVVLSGMSAAERRRHQVAVLALAREGHDGLRLRSVALLVDDGVPCELPDLLWASDQALHEFDHELALRLADRAVALEDSVGAHLARGSALSAMGRAAEAERAFDLAIAMAPDEGWLARAASRRCEHLAFRRYLLPDAVDEALAVLSRLTDPAARELIETDLVKWRWASGDRATVPVQRMGDLSEAARLNLLHAEVIQASLSGRLARARAALELARPLVPGQRHTQPHMDTFLDVTELVTVAMEGPLPAAVAYAEGRLGPAGGTRDENAGLWSYLCGVLALAQGDHGRAVAQTAEALPLLRWRDFTGRYGAALATHAAGLAASGRTDEAEAELAQLTGDHFADPSVGVHAAHASFWVHHRRGEHEEARRRLVEVADGADAMGYVFFGSFMLHDGVRLGHAVGARLAALLDGAEGALAAAYAAHLDALASREPEALAKAGGLLADVGVVAGSESAFALAAEGFRAAGNRDEAARCARLAAGQLTPPSLSRRELEVVRLAAAGLRSREIAERLTLSVRTVDNHLARVFRRFDLAGRAHLPELLARVGG